MNLAVDAITDPAEFESLGSEWDACLHPDDPIAVFLRHGWFAAWRRAFLTAAGDRLYILRIADGGSTVAFAPFYATRRATPLGPAPLIRFLVNAHSHKIDFICHPDRRPQVVAAVMDHLQSLKSTPLLELEDLETDSPTCDAIREWTSANNWNLGEEYIRQSPYLNFEGIDTWAQFRAGLSKKFRETTNNARNRLQRAGKVAVRCITKPDELERIWPEIEHISACSWQGLNHSGVCARPDTSLFYKEMLRWAVAREVGRLWLCTVDGKAIAYEIHLKGADVEYGLKAEFDQDHRSDSPGAALDAMIVERLIDEGVSQYDLLGYADAYKLRWTDELRSHVRLFAYPKRPCGRAAYFVAFPLKRAVKKLPGAVRLKRKLLG